MERHALSPKQAFTFLRRVSQNSNTELADVAEQPVDSRLTPYVRGPPGVDTRT